MPTSSQALWLPSAHLRRVDTVPPLDTSDPAALLRAAAASLAGADAGAAAHHTGSAAYLLASMLNHRWGLPSHVCG